MIYFCNTLTTEQAQQLSREQLISWLEWNDHNGCYSDEDSLAEGMEIMPTERALEYVLKQLAEGAEL